MCMPAKKIEAPCVRCPRKNGRHSPGRPTGRLGATAQLCAPRTLCCEAFELLRLRPGPVQPSLGPKSTRPTPSLQWAHQSNLGRTSAQRCPALEPDGANPFCTTAVPPRGWSNRAVPTRSGRILAKQCNRLTLIRGDPPRSQTLLPGFEPGLPDSRSGVLTTTLQELCSIHRARPGSNQGPFGLQPNALPLSYVPVMCADVPIT